MKGKIFNMSEWKKYKLIDVLDLIGGGTPKTSCKEYWNGEIPWISVADFNNERKYVANTEKRISQKGLNNSSTKLLDKGDIIISARGTVGVIAMLSKIMAFNQSCYGIKANDLSFNNFVYYLLKYCIGELRQFSHGGVFDTITKDTFKEIDIILPSLPEQERIASILSSLDDKIDLLNRQNQTLESIAEVLFRHYFIDNAQPDWKDGVISDLIDFNPTRKLTKNTVAPFLEMSELSTRTYAPNGWYERAYTSGTKFQNGDTLLARITPCLENGKTAYVDFLKKDQVGWGSTEYIVMRPKEILHPFFAYVIAKLQDFRDFAESCMSGSSGRQRVDVENLKSYEIQIPDSENIKHFNVFAESTVSKMNNNNQQIHTLTKLRDTLLPMLMSAEVKI